jgi:hypothetical protein
MTNPTTPFSWQMPTSSDLVTDLPADFETFGQAVATSMADLLGGTSGQVLSKASNTDMDFTWVTTDDTNAIQNAIVDAKGDLIAATAADTPARLAVGADYGFLQALASESTGLKWDAGAYTSYTPTLSATTGSFTSATVTGLYKRIGKVCLTKVQVAITTNGTAGGALITTPFTPTSYATGTWREVISTGISGQIFLSTATQFQIVNNDNSNPCANNRTFQCSIVFEVA